MHQGFKEKGTRIGGMGICIKMQFVEVVLGTKSWKYVAHPDELF